MADEIDIANERAQLRLDKYLEVRKPVGPVPTGFCLNCNDPFDEDIIERRWCDFDCQSDWAKREERALNRKKK